MQNWNPEKIVYFIDVRQQLHLKQVFTISRLAGWILAPLNKGELKGDFVSTELFFAYN
jgi:arginyl-tRNA synthetase